MHSGWMGSKREGKALPSGNEQEDIWPASILPSTCLLRPYSKTSCMEFTELKEARNNNANESPIFSGSVSQQPRSLYTT